VSCTVLASSASVDAGGSSSLDVTGWNVGVGFAFFFGGGRGGTSTGAAAPAPSSPPLVK
jgi:hypothetical protein